MQSGPAFVSCFRSGPNERPWSGRTRRRCMYRGFGHGKVPRKVVILEKRGDGTRGTMLVHGADVGMGGRSAGDEREPGRGVGGFRGWDDARHSGMGTFILTCSRTRYFVALGCDAVGDGRVPACLGTCLPTRHLSCHVLGTMAGRSQDAGHRRCCLLPVLHVLAEETESVRVAESREASCSAAFRAVRGPVTDLLLPIATYLTYRLWLARREYCRLGGDVCTCTRAVQHYLDFIMVTTPFTPFVHSTCESTVYVFSAVGHLCRDSRCLSLG